MSNKTHYVSLNGKVTSTDQAVISANNSALYYGTGCFETLVAEQSLFFKLNEHIDRLNRGMEYLSGGTVEPLSADQLKRDILQLLKRSQLQKDRVRVRIQFSLLEESGYSAEQNPQTQLLITISKAEQSAEPWKLKTSQTRVVSQKSRPTDLKLSNMLHYRHAWREARSAGFDDAILLTYDDYIAETAIANLFWKKGNVVYTPSSLCDILPGIMRNSIIGIIKSRTDLEIIEGKYQRSDIMSADSVWMTNSVRELQEISEIDGQKFETDQPFVSQLKKLLKDYKTEHIS